MGEGVSLLFLAPFHIFFSFDLLINERRTKNTPKPSCEASYVRQIMIIIFKRRLLILSWLNRGEKSLRHVAMVANFLDDNKPKTSLKRWIRTDSNFINFIQFHLICQMLAIFPGWIPKDGIYKFPKKKRKFLCCVRRLHKACAWN